MTAEEMVVFLKNCTPEMEISFRVAIHCGPVLKKVKASNSMMVKQEGQEPIRKALEKSPIACSPLYTGNGKALLLFYRQEQLETCLSRKENREFLKGFGYSDTQAASAICRLRERYQEYVAYGKGFPHEMGIILGYPVEDVAGFMKHQGQGCLLQRYWKVYHNLDEARATFARYDQAREQAMEEVAAGYPLKQVAVS